MTPPTDWHPSIPPTNYQDMNRPFTNQHLPNPHYHQPSGHLPNPHYHQPAGLHGKCAPGFVIPAQYPSIPPTYYQQTIHQPTPTKSTLSSAYRTSMESMHQGFVIPAQYPSIPHTYYQQTIHQPTPTKSTLSSAYRTSRKARTRICYPRSTQHQQCLHMSS